jgi:cell wall assembly regulator SMI1
MRQELNNYPDIKRKYFYIHKGKDKLNCNSSELCSSKWHEMKKMSYNWENIFAIYITDKILVCQVYK